MKEKILKNKEEILLIGLILLLSFATRFFYFGYPNKIVFDEVYFARFTTSYYKGEFYFDIHPPLAKLMMFAWTKLVKANPPKDFPFEKIGDPYPNNYYLFLRGLVSFFGALLPLGIYLLTKELFKNRWPAFLASFLAIFDNALLVQSRFILIDIFLLVFGVFGLYFFLRHFSQKTFSFLWFFYLFLGSLFLTASFSIKWTGLVFLGVAVFLTFLKEKKIEFFGWRWLLVLLIFLLFYSTIFWLHFKLLYQTGGEADKFFSPSFQKTLRNNPFENDPKVQPANFYEKFIEMNLVMFTANAGLKATHSYGSSWYSWPFLYRPIYYWYGKGDCQDCQNQKAGRIYLLGNPFVWWLGLILVIFSLFWLIFQFFQSFKKEEFFAILILLVGYFANLFPYLGIKRVAFLYHYFPSLIFLLSLSGFWLWKFFSKKTLFLILILLVIVYGFVFFAPLSYGFYLTPSEYHSRIWLPSWR